MSISIVREKIIKEVQLIPEEKLSEIYNFLHFFRLGIQKPKGNSKEILKFAGSWKDMPEDIFQEFADDIVKRRKNAFSGRRTSGTSID